MKKRFDFQPKEDICIGDKYRLKTFIHTGSFGSVWKAENLISGEVVALKIPINQEKADHTLSEGKHLIGVRHPNLITLNWMGRIEGLFVIEMELYEGSRLSDLMDNKGFKEPKTFDEIKDIAIQVIEGIEFIHSKKISHGDIKPNNILLRNNNIKLTDFGTSKFIDDVYVDTPYTLGTWAYIAPEVAGTHKRYLNSDIYSLGVLLYQLLTGRTPHQTSLQVINNYYYPSPKEINPSITEDMDKVILKCLERNPEERYQSVTELKKDFIKAWRSLNIRSFNETKIQEVPKEQDKAWIEKVQTLISGNHFTEADKILDQQLVQSHNPDAFFYKAISYYKQRSNTLALECLEKINMEEVESLRKDAFWEAVLNLKGKIYLKTKKYDMAISVFRSLMEKNPDSIDYSYKLASTLALIHHEKEAISILERINLDTPGILTVIKKIGYAYDQIRDFKKARSYYLHALTIDPDDKHLKKRLSIINT